jgi:hypothetical protein
MFCAAPQRGDRTRPARVARRERPLGRRGTPGKDRSNTASTSQQPPETSTLGYQLG